MECKNYKMFYLNLINSHKYCHNICNMHIISWSYDYIIILKLTLIIVLLKLGTNINNVMVVNYWHETSKNITKLR